MADNVIKFRKVEKKPEKPEQKPEWKSPGWLPWVVLVAVAIAIVAVQQSGLFGG